LRTIFYFVIIGAIAMGGAWFADHPGEVVIDWFGYEAQTSVGVLIILLLALLAIAFFGLSLLRTLMNSARIFKERRLSRRRAKASAELLKGFNAIAIGDATVARRALKSASVSKELHGLTKLLGAQIAELSRDTKATEAAYRELLKNPETEYLGLRGLFN